MGTMWNQVNPYAGYVNNPFAVSPYFPLYGMNQPVLGSQFFMNMNGRNSMSAPNPLSYSYNYPKVPHITGTQYSTYPKFKQQQKLEKEEKEPTINNLRTQNSSNKRSKTQELTQKLNEEIKKLEELTLKAKELAGGKIENNNKESKEKKEEVKKNVETTTNDTTKQKSNLRKANKEEEKAKHKKLNSLNGIKINGNTNITKEEKQKFDSHMKEIMEKLSKIK